MLPPVCFHFNVSEWKKVIFYCLGNRRKLQATIWYMYVKLYNIQTPLGNWRSDKVEKFEFSSVGWILFESDFALPILSQWIWKFTWLHDNVGSPATAAMTQRHDFIHSFWLCIWNLHHPLHLWATSHGDAVNFKNFTHIYFKGEEY